VKVREEVIDVGLYVTNGKLYRYLYEDHQCVPVEDVVLCARSHKERSKFNVPYNNCEDFAVRCKTIAAGASSSVLATSEPCSTAPSTLQAKASGFVAGISAGLAEARAREDDKAAAAASLEEKPIWAIRSSDISVDYYYWERC